MKPYLKPLTIIFMLLIFRPAISHAQEISTEKQLLGTILFKENVFNYSFKYGKNYSFQLERVTATSGNSPESIKLFFDKLSQTLSQKKLDTLVGPDTTNVKKSIANAQHTYSIADDNKTKAYGILDSISTVLKQKAAGNKDSIILKDIVKNINDFTIVTNTASATGENHSLPTLLDAELYKTLLKSDFRKWGLYTDSDIPHIKILADQLYNEINVRMKFKNDEPTTAYLKLKSDVIPIYYGKNNSTVLTQMKVINIQFEFEEGTIKNIYAEFSKDEIDGIDGKFEFRNNKPISISGKYDPGLYNDQMIYAYEISSTQKEKLKTYLKRNESLNNNLYFRLGDVIKYLLILENRKEDYSPADCKVDLSPQNPLVVLKKQLRSKILTVKAFSDFNGINNEAPNGLVQFEATIGTNLVTRRFQGLMCSWPYDWYTGLLTRVELTGTLSKIEQNNKYMVLNGSFLNKDSLNAGIKSFNINAINLLKYQNNGINLNLYIYKLNIPQAKMNFQFNGSAGILRTGITDSITLDKTSATGYSTLPSRNSRTITSSNFSWTALLEFNPENRYGFSIAYRQRFLNPLSPDVTHLTGKDKRINTVMIDGFIGTSENTKIFFRWHLNRLATDSRNNYNQVQLGYLIDVFKTNGD